MKTIYSMKLYRNNVKMYGVIILINWDSDHVFFEFLIGRSKCNGCSKNA